mmetsp:Transcript_58846/g.126661  ORF Transcript_58846/g.126661 Transcript_58846/m.126661 type:complete len:665 (-) Transcript_58846:95-2089(-)
MKVFVSVLTMAAASGTEAQANPIRRVVSMLQDMQAKIEEEGKRQTKAMNKYRCYCKSNDEELSKSITDGKAYVELLESKIQAATNGKTQAEADLKQSKEDRAEANKAVEDAQAAREKEAKEFAEESGEMKSNIEAMGKAIPAIENGMSGSFLQTVGRLVANSPNLAAEEREQVQEFIQSKTSAETGYAPASGQIVGILKQMKETMEADLAELTKQENEAIASFNGLQAAKNKEIQASTESIEENSAKIGELGVSIVTMQGNKKDTADTIGADEGFLEELGKSCKDMEKDFEQIVASRSEELSAIADTIKVLNDDDALELFKKSIPSTSLLQVQVTSKEVRSAALAALEEGHRGSVNLDLIALALRGKKKGMEEVTGMIDGMMNQLHAEQKDDDAKKSYCSDEIDKVEDHIKEVKIQIESVKAHIADDEDAIQTYKAQVADLNQSIKELDKAVAAATEQRKAEHQAYVDESAQNQAALELLEFAKNRLNKFYNPEQYKEPEPEQLSEEERVEQAYSFVQTSHSKENSNGVIHLLDMLRNDLKLEMNENKMEEEQGQKAYEKLSSDATAKRSAATESLADKESALAAAEGELLDLKVELKETNGDHMEAKQTESNLHAECDFLVANFDARKQARDDELEALDKAKAVLAGADYSFVQVSQMKFLSK